QHVDQNGLNNAAIHALWTINGLNAIENNNEALKVVRTALYHKAWAVRKAALQMLPRNTQSDAAILKANTLYDTDPRVQLATLLYFTERPSSTKMGQLMYNLSQDQKVMSDPWLYKALYANAAIHLSGFLNAFHKANPTHEISFEKRVDMSLVNYDDSDWETMELPQYIENAGLDIDGVIWFRREVNIPA
ncbi:MAG TPA: dehydrogenase, partial [Maribacter sp.]|nr:dehydrogenase [Maribacter sp.]